LFFSPPVLATANLQTYRLPNRLWFNFLSVILCLTRSLERAGQIGFFFIVIRSSKGSSIYSDVAALMRLFLHHFDASIGPFETLQPQFPRRFDLF